MSKAPETAPALPVGCVDFNKLHDGLFRGDPNAVGKALVVPEGERPLKDDATSAPAPSSATKPE